VVAAVVSIPMSIGFGLLAFAPFGERFLPIGILAGLYGAIFLGLAALVLGARGPMVYAPRSLIAFMVGSIALHSFAESGSALLAEPDPIYLSGALLATLALAGLFQVVFGAARLGALVRFIPAPVMAGFQNAASLLILYSQVHVLLGLPKRLPPAALPAALADAKLLNLLLGAATIAVIWNGARISRRLPPALIGLIFGTLAYYLMCAAGLEARLGPTIGAIPQSTPDGRFFGAIIVFGLHPAALELAPAIAASALSLAVVASLDTLICARIVEAMTGRRGNASRTLQMAGGANLIASMLGGLCGGVSVASSTANYKAGARTSLSLLVHSLVLCAAVVAMASLLGRLPLVVVGAVLVVTAAQLIDKWSLRLVRKIASREMVDWRAIALDLAVIVTVAATAIAGDIVVAVLIGVGVAVVLFVLRMSRSIVRRERYGDSMRSRRARDAADSDLLARHGRGIVLLDLEGPVFFGSAESLSERIDAAPGQGARYVILDFRRVNDLDSTGAHVLLHAQDRLKARGVHFLLASTHAVPHVGVVLRDSGVLGAVTSGRIFADADRALEWAENHLIEALRASEARDGEYPFVQLDLLAGFSAQERDEFRALLRRRTYGPGESVFREGGDGDELFIIARGSASVMLAAGGEQEQRLVTFAAGTAFGEMALLDSEARSATVQADEALVVYVLERSSYERIVREMRPIAIKLMTNLGRELSARLRRANRMLNQLEL
jgi:MFS superfamily sulfate permease-like transporter